MCQTDSADNQHSAEVLQSHPASVPVQQWGGVITINYPDSDSKTLCKLQDG